MFTQDRGESRQYFISVWQKHQQGQALEPLEKMVLQVIIAHPEYQALLVEKNLDKDYLPEMGETNPFLHMGLHLALHEQISTDRPTGVRDIYQQLRFGAGDIHDMEHHMIECLMETLWTAQRTGQMPNEANYLTCLRHLQNRK